MRDIDILMWMGIRLIQNELVLSVGAYILLKHNKIDMGALAYSNADENKKPPPKPTHGSYAVGGSYYTEPEPPAGPTGPPGPGYWAEPTVNISGQVNWAPMSGQIGSRYNGKPIVNLHSKAQRYDTYGFILRDVHNPNNRLQYAINISKFMEDKQPCECKHMVRYHTIHIQDDKKWKQFNEDIGNHNYNSYDYSKPQWLSRCNICNETCHNTLKVATRDMRVAYKAEMEQAEYDNKAKQEQLAYDREHGLITSDTPAKLSMTQRVLMRAKKWTLS